MPEAPPSSLPHYDAHAQDYVQALLTHDVAEARAAFLEELPSPAAILDFGCGPGRDLAAFAADGHEAVGLEGSPALAAAARAQSRCTVWEMDLFTADLPPGRFSGVWAQAVLFHVPTAALQDVLMRIRGTLRPGGIFYACDPTGDGAEGYAVDRYLAFRRPQSFKKAMRSAGFAPLRDWRRPPGMPRRQQNWLASLWRAP